MRITEKHHCLKFRGRVLEIDTIKESDEKVEAGRLDERVMVCRWDTSTKDSANQPIRLPVEIAGRWAEVKSLKGREFWEAAQVKSEVTHRVILRSGELTDRPCVYLELLCKEQKA